MKNFFKIILVSAVVLSFTSCSSTFGTLSSNNWKPFELRPSQIKTNGEVFFRERLINYSRFEVFWDYSVYNDAEFYYERFMQDFGWHRNTNGNWSGYGAIRQKDGFLYVNTKKRVGIYFNPKTKNYSVFKVRFY